MKKRKIVLITAIIAVIAVVAGFGIKHLNGQAERNEVEVVLPSASGADFADTLSEVLKNHYGASDELYCTEMSFNFDGNGDTKEHPPQCRIQIHDKATGDSYYILRSENEEKNPTIYMWHDGNYEFNPQFESLPAENIFEIFRSVSFAELVENQTGIKYDKFHVEYRGDTTVTYPEYTETDAYDFRIPTYIYKDGEVKQVLNCSEIKEDCRTLEITYNDNEGSVNVIISGDEINMINLLVPIG